jgi:archaeal type IV pilus assembly protein PilA
LKKIWRIRNESRAVSPVIATILMVAITVVLAASVYLTALSFGTSTQSTPAAAMTYQKTGTGWYTFTVGGVTRNGIISNDVMVMVTPNDGLSVINSTNEVLQAGYSISVIGTTSGMTYTITLVYLLTGGAICQTRWTAT